ncbi:MAG TPA: sigma-54 dependent transcriptional regulator [Vicinamibacterales bacterium]|nr:sigma-54 dependent transcriptional regulator [Vicinamibacterales bacterium]
MIIDSKSRPRLLVVDDEPSILEILGRFGEQSDFDVVACAGGAEALAYLKHQGADVAAVDLRMPEVGGLQVLRAIREADPDCQVVLMSGEATIDSAVEAIKLGAIDYLTKPFDFPRLKRLLSVVSEDTAQRRRLLHAEQEMAKNTEFCGMIGRGATMQELFRLIRRLAPHVRTVLITGETGTGKELVARAFHRSGPRASKRFITINCSAVVETLFESELFGHARGSFTGATDNKPGLFEVAHGGTLFLDEIGELPLLMQAKLLRVLETGEVQRVGSVDPRSVDVHILTATNRNLQADAAAGRFRSDLYYRLNVVELRVPSLRERREDIPYLTAAFVRESAARLGKRLVGLTAAAERTLMSAAFNGNIRELRNAIERACILADSEFITEREFTSSVSQLPSSTAGSNGEGLLSAVERDHIVEVLAGVRGNKAQAARALGLDRRSLYRRLELYQIGTIARRSIQP